MRRGKKDNMKRPSDEVKWSYPLSSLLPRTLSNNDKCSASIGLLLLTGTAVHNSVSGRAEARIVVCLASGLCSCFALFTVSKVFSRPRFSARRDAIFSPSSARPHRFNRVDAMDVESKGCLSFTYLERKDAIAARRLCGGPTQRRARASQS